MIMFLNQEKLRFPDLRFTILRLFNQLKKRREDNALTRRTLKIASARLDKWVKEGKYLTSYDSKEDILKDLDLTSDELNLYCKVKFGKPFLSWRKELRMVDARRMLMESPDLPAYKVGIAVGIRDKSDFRHQFKSATGMTPTQWRKKYSRKNLE